MIGEMKTQIDCAKKLDEDPDFYSNENNNFLKNESNSKKVTEVSYLETMNNDEEDNENTTNTLYLEKIQIVSPKKFCSMTNIPIQSLHSENKESINSIVNTQNNLDSEPEENEIQERPFFLYNCESIVENFPDNLSINEKAAYDPEFKIIKSQMLEKLNSDKSFFSIYNENNNSSNFSPKIEEYYSKPVDTNEEEYQNYLSIYNETTIKTLFSQIGLDQFSSEEIIDAIFSNDALKKINFTIFKIKFEVKFIFLNSHVFL